MMFRNTNVPKLHSTIRLNNEYYHQYLVTKKLHSGINFSAMLERTHVCTEILLMHPSTRHSHLHPLLVLRSRDVRDQCKRNPLQTVRIPAISSKLPFEN